MNGSGGRHASRSGRRGVRGCIYSPVTILKRGHIIKDQAVRDIASTGKIRLARRKAVQFVANLLLTCDDSVRWRSLERSGSRLVPGTKVGVERTSGVSGAWQVLRAEGRNPLQRSSVWLSWIHTKISERRRLVGN
jgi:hypothetical protein